MGWGLNAARPCATMTRLTTLSATEENVPTIAGSAQMTSGHTGFGRAVAAIFIATSVFTVCGCGKIDADRAQSEATARAHVAIAAYSAASQAANGLHGEVIDAFQRANRSPSLPDYRDAIRKGVLPAMDRFIERLRAMPTDIEDLERIHAGLVRAYSEARDQLAAYADNLNAAANLSEFQPIREQLRQRVSAYRNDLEAYYRGQNRQLRNDAPPLPAEATKTTP